ncbi:DUF2637 domain-containing protein [Streptomyces sp. NBC_01410]|uniref:DUF2637 domain-containing protein n=1 Tax=Streptomyces sp. NBC_01410 TaxID=2903856 RepID=UPI0032536ADD
MNAVHIRSAERALSVGTWPLAAAHTPDRWDWTAPILPLVVDAAVVIVVRLDAVLARLGGNGGRWPIALRWMTGCMTLALNVADSALKNDLVGVAVHAVAPLLLIVTAETGLAYRRAITAAVVELEAKQHAEREARERAAIERRDESARRAREEREHAAALVREQREHEALMVREQAEREAAARREEREREQVREAAERAEHERSEREREQSRRERERREREAAERAERERTEREERAARERAALLSAGPATDKLPEDEARAIVAAAHGEGMSVRTAAELCGWSVGWVSTRYAELRGPVNGTPVDLAGTGR